VLWGPLQSECLAALGVHSPLFVAGNCEREVLAGADESSVWCRDQLTSAELDFVASWPLTVELEIDGLGSVSFCHATPRSDEEILTRTTPDTEVAEALADVAAGLVVCGHTHVQYDRQVPVGPRLVNAGSVGLPYQGEPGAFWLLLDDEVELRRTVYDTEAALTSLTSTGFPDAARIFAESIEGRASAESATAFFESKRAEAADRG
jgi:diadenosine tetraphosphatase ApaH/serine/threonine PP2A family protein phosphatase